MRVLAFTKYDCEAASTRQRLLQYLPTFAAAGIEVEVQPLLGNDYVRHLASGAGYSRAALARSYGERARRLLARPDYDLLWVYAELFPYLPGRAERLAFRSGRPLVYDWDDAFFEPYRDPRRPWLMRLLLQNKLQPLIAGAGACTCGNEYLRDIAAQWCERAIIVPTVVDTNRYEPIAKLVAGDPVVIGWIGSPTTWPNVRPLLPLIARLRKQWNVRLRVVGAGASAERDRIDGVDFIEWSEESEIAEVQAMDIGIMPLDDSLFNRGKSGYKLIQYMACGLPTVASPVGVNREIVTPETGFLVDDEAGWANALSALIRDADLRRRMGAAGRARAVERYSLASQAPTLVELFRDLTSSSVASRTSEAIS
ncbi:glycosyltransferase family 4 protein [Sphingomonas ginkgonis]|nr:glycosyltransferase family 4 protein [Sphingomonas ginkgonis]